MKINILMIIALSLSIIVLILAMLYDVSDKGIGFFTLFP